MSFARHLRWFSMALVVSAVAIVVISAGNGDSGSDAQRTIETVDSLSAVATSASIQRASRYQTTVHRPDGPPVIESDGIDPQGRTGTIACSTCHSVRPANRENRHPSDLDQFHQQMQYAHGTLTCYSCHNSGDMDALQLADGARVEYRDVMTLCAQCHGPQSRDFQHGAHGGMNGHWDLDRGPRTKNGCVDCHDPHVPKFPMMVPTFKPKDRFLDKVHSSSTKEESVHE